MVVEPRDLVVDGSEIVARANGGGEGGGAGEGALEQGTSGELGHRSPSACPGAAVKPRRLLLSATCARVRA